MQRYEILDYISINRTMGTALGGAVHISASDLKRCYFKAQFRFRLDPCAERLRRHMFIARSRKRPSQRMHRFAFSQAQALAPTPFRGSSQFQRNAVCIRGKNTWASLTPSFKMQANSGTETASSTITRVKDGGITTAGGFRAAGTTAGFKASGLPDLAIILPSDPLSEPAVGAAVFTQSRVRAAPVDLAMSNLKASRGQVSAIVINSGQANAATGAAGYDDAVRTTQITADVIGCDPKQVLVASTGIIGFRIDMELMKKAIPGMVESALRTDSSLSQQAGVDAATAIMTTDLKRKEASFEAVVTGKPVRIGGMAKGSGMIHPSMATMLGFVTCDALVEQDLWQAMLRRATDKSFNMITVDGDTSTNDVLFAICNGSSGVKITEANSVESKIVEDMLTKTCCELAKQIARDGEGATVLIEVRVCGASSDAAARKVARTVAGSSLVKAAVFGRDPNWGRIAAAAGRAGVSFDPRKMSISLGEYLLVETGEPRPFDAKGASAYMRQKASASASEEEYCSDADTVAIEIDLGDGSGIGTAWGCDLSYKYVEINSEYTT